MRRSLLPLSLCLLALPHGACDCVAEPLAPAQPGLVLPELVEFGPVVEGTSAEQALVVENAADGELHVEIELDAEASSPDFAFEAVSLDIKGRDRVELRVAMLAGGAGEDTGTLTVSSNDPAQRSASVALHAGPIAPALDVVDEVDFRPADASIVGRTVSLTNVGSATLHVASVLVDDTGSPDFSVVGSVADVLVGQALDLQVQYRKSGRVDEGRLLISTDDPADTARSGVRTVRLLPDPVAACEDGLDNDGDTLADFPDDPGCDTADDPTEDNFDDCVDGAQQPCGSDVGLCEPGLRTCTGGAFGGCDGETGPVDELCDGQDQNCNGLIDDGVSEPCDASGCAGVRICVEGGSGTFGPCLPLASNNETCNGLDDNCDGTIDNSVSQACVVNGCAGNQVCVPGGSGTFTACQPTNPGTEVCNSLDDDCNGTADDITTPSTCGLGICRRNATCTNGMESCTTGAPSAEACNNLDDDCNGVVDNGAVVTCGTGACLRSGTCAAAGNPQCTPGAPATEACNNVDDDCNGIVDNGAVVTCGTGACLRSGTCNSGSPQCTPGTPGTEVCNSIDDNCNGQTDENTVTCGLGACQRTGTCALCTPGAPAASETCGNGIDDNCNGTVDDPAQCGSCTVGGTYNLAAAIGFQCCLSAAVNVNRFTLNAAGTTSAEQSPITGVNLAGNAATCPSGTFTHTATLFGGCNETYTLNGTFTSANTFVGTFDITFTGDPFQCSCFDGALGTPCTDQSFPVTATKP